MLKRSRSTLNLWSFTHLSVHFIRASRVNLYPIDAMQYSTPRLLSVQSHTVHGFVGNKASTFPLQCLGFNVDAINCVTLSNHPGYRGGFKGERMPPEKIQDIVEGLRSNDLMHYDIVLTGYLSSVETAEQTAAIIKELKETDPKVIYVCDPVLGDMGRFYLPPELSDTFRTQLLPLATVATPNQFEAEVLSGIKIDTIDSAKQVCSIFHDMGVNVCILKGLHLSDGSYSVVISSRQETPTGESNDKFSSTAHSSQIILRIDIPKINDRHFSGCGDLFSSLSAGVFYSLAQTTDVHDACVLGTMIESVSAMMFDVLNITHRKCSTELCIVESIESFRKYHNLLPLKLEEDTAEFKSENACIVPTTEATSQGHRFEKLFSTLLPSARKSSYVIQGPIAGVIFDMDGTLTEPGAIDFAAMYRRIGLRRGPLDLLAQVEAIEDEDQRSEAHAIIVDEELKGIERMRIRKDAILLMEALHRQRIRAALSTRNCEIAMLKFFAADAAFHERFYPAVHRDSLQGINKPDPRVAEHILTSWNAKTLSSDSGDVWFVGDSHDDVACGRAAGCKTCLILTDFNRDLPSTHPHLIDLAVGSLHELGCALGLEMPPYVEV